MNKYQTLIKIQEILDKEGKESYKKILKILGFDWKGNCTDSLLSIILAILDNNAENFQIIIETPKLLFKKQERKVLVNNIVKKYGSEKLKLIWKDYKSSVEFNQSIQPLRQ